MSIKKKERKWKIPNSKAASLSSSRVQIGITERHLEFFLWLLGCFLFIRLHLYLSLLDDPFLRVLFDQCRFLLSPSITISTDPSVTSRYRINTSNDGEDHLLARLLTRHLISIQREGGLWSEQTTSSVCENRWFLSSSYWASIVSLSASLSISRGLACYLEDEWWRFSEMKNSFFVSSPFLSLSRICALVVCRAPIEITASFYVSLLPTSINRE